MAWIKLNWKRLFKRPSILLLSISSYSTVFSSIDPEKDLDKDWLLEQFSITKVNLCRLYVEYYDSIDSKKLALDFANYGLSITPKIASIPKNFFKTYICSGEIVKTTY